VSNKDIKILYLDRWADLEELSPLQNRWLRLYTKPSVAVILQTWVKHLPPNFTLEYLLTHFIATKWELTEEGWKKAEELGLLTNYERESESVDIEETGDWISHADAARQLHKENVSPVQLR
jgi:hypothetical protein